MANASSKTDRKAAIERAKKAMLADKNKVMAMKEKLKAEKGKTLVSWVQCDKCDKWRELPPHVSLDAFSALDWNCSLMTWDDADPSCIDEAHPVEETLQKESEEENNNKRDDVKKDIEIFASKRDYPEVQVTVRCKLLGVTMQEYDVIEPTSFFNLQDDHDESSYEEEDTPSIKKLSKKKCIVKWAVAVVVGVIILRIFFLSAIPDNTGHCLAIADY